jgi:hypothetical protein
MKITSTSLSAVGQSPWINVDETQAAFGVGFNVDLDSAASGITFKVEHTFDDLSKFVPATIARSGTTVTLVVPSAHNLNTGDSVIVRFGDSLANTTGLDGTYTVTVTNTTTLTYTSLVSGSVSTTGWVDVVPLRVQTNASVSGNTSSVDGNYAFPVEAVRLNVTAWTAGKATLTLVQGRK